MKIAFLNGYSNTRGAETFVNELSNELFKKNEVTLILGDRKIPRRWPFLWRAFMDPHGFYTFTFTFKNLNKIWREKFDIVIPINGGWQPALIRMVTWLYGGKMIISGQSGIGWDDKNNLWCFPDRFVALSTYAKKWAKKVNPFVKIEYIPNGVDVTKFTPEGKSLKTHLKKPIILTVSALTPTKRVDLVIQAVSRMKSSSLLIVGDGPDRQKLNEMGKTLLGERFQIISSPFEEMPSVYRIADVFTLVSQPYYSFEIAIVEALATNIPVVVNNDPIRAEIVDDAGFLVNPNDNHSYSLALKKALLAKWYDKPKMQAQKFSWDIISDKYESLFRELRGN
ncbi:hypothetical protein A2962_05145 [Candidatus Woesebacteria bacterium RIFCSPLOWO2_01_FULL_39_61]|nr:MAG: hypothetical protein A2962_05145 [Candidatus Woesebacteria bacterium RIFCSPLOWO2_01_FULL_39_61]OGM73792.1 MAG: hypothetical protein A3H19_02665 [Candidatus Woesebacteria bacterium RIFCSPLOWO2_12_FULL_39_9]